MKDGWTRDQKLSIAGIVVAIVLFVLDRIETVAQIIGPIYQIVQPVSFIAIGILIGWSLSRVIESKRRAEKEAEIAALEKRPTQEEFSTLDPDMKSIVFRLYMVEYLDDRDGSFIRFENALDDQEIARGFDSLISFETLVPDGYRMRLKPEVRKLIDKRPHLLDQAREAKAYGSESMPVRAVRIVGDKFQFDKQAYDSWLAKGAAILRARDEPARYLQLASPEELDALMLFIDHDNMVPEHDYDRVSGRLGTLEEAGVIAPLDRGIGDAAYQLDPDFYKCLKASEDSLGMSDGRSKGDLDF